MNIFFREMKAHRKSLIIWCIAMLFMVAAGMAKYGGYNSSGQNMDDIIEKMPKILKNLLGFGSYDLSKASGYYGFLFLYLIIMATIHASMLGANIISKEERDKTTEFLMVKPVSRTKIITSKLLAAGVNGIILNIVTWLSSLAIVVQYSRGEDVTGEIAILMGGMFILQLIFMFIGTAIAAAGKHPKSAASLATGILLFTFVISIAINLNSNFEILKYITPFKYYEADKLMYGGGFDPVFVVLSGLIVFALIRVTYTFYKKRDLNV